MEEHARGLPSLFTVTLIQLGVGALLFISLLYGQRDLTILTFLVLVVIGGARLWAGMSLSGLRCRLTLDKRQVFPGEKVTLQVSAENAKLLPIWLQMFVPVGRLRQRSSGESVLSKASSLLWYQRTEFEWEFKAERRGVYRIGPLHILAGDLFSFFSKLKRSEDRYSLIVYPRLAALNPLSLPRRDFFGVPRAKSPVEDPIYILGTRDYAPGKPSKYIHWKASARHNRLQEKVFESTTQEKVLLVLAVDSFAAAGAEEDWERMLEIAASLAARLDRQGHSVGLVANGVLEGGGAASVPVARNYRHLPAILEALARLTMNPEGDLKELLRRRLADAWGITCAYFSHTLDTPALSAKEYLALRNTPAVFFVCGSHPPAADDGTDLLRKVYYLDDVLRENDGR